MEKVYVRLIRHSEFMGFCIHDGVFKSIENAISDIIGANSGSVSMVLINRVGDCTYVMVFGDCVSLDDIAEIDGEFKKNPLEVCYNGDKSLYSFCILESVVK